MKRFTPLFFAIGILLSFAACQSEQANDETSTDAEVDLQTALQGTWQTFQVNVAINTADGRDTFRTQSFTEETWEQGFGMEPPVYYFQPDQQFRVVNRNLDGEVVGDSRGMWNTFGDTLVLIEAEETNQYLVKIGNGRAAFRNFQDWDEDGEVDDEYQGLLRQISISIESKN